MKKMIAIAVVLAVASIFAFSGCKTENAPKPAEQSSGTTTAPSPKPSQGC